MALCKTFHNDINLALPSSYLRRPRAQPITVSSSQPDTSLAQLQGTSSQPATGRRGKARLRRNINKGAMGGMEASALARMLPTLSSSRGGLSRGATSPNRRAACGGRRGSRQIRARRPRQEPRGRDGEQQRPPERSPRLRRLRGARAAAGTMLEEPECGAPDARGAATGWFGLARWGRGAAVCGLCGLRRRLRAEGPPATAPGPLSARGAVTV